MHLAHVEEKLNEEEASQIVITSLSYKGVQFGHKWRHKYLMKEPISKHLTPNGSLQHEQA